VEETAIEAQETRPQNGHVVRAEGVTRIYGEGDTAVNALRGVDLTLERGRFVAIMGPSGSGKSTLMHILAGIDHPTDGRVWIGEHEITAMNDRDLTHLRRHSVGFVFQFFNLLPMLTARENLDLPLDIGDIKPDRLSGGERQRVAMARALANNPALILGDEPTGNLDSKTGAEILTLLRRSVDEFEQTIVMVTHDPHAASIADRVLFLQDGRIVKDGARMDADAIFGVMRGLE